MKDAFYFILCCFIVLLSVLAIMFYNDYQEDRKFNNDMREELYHELMLLKPSNRR